MRKRAPEWAYVLKDRIIAAGFSDTRFPQIEIYYDDNVYAKSLVKPASPGDSAVLIVYAWHEPDTSDVSLCIADLLSKLKAEIEGSPNNRYEELSGGGGCGEPETVLMAIKHRFNADVLDGGLTFSDGVRANILKSEMLMHNLIKRVREEVVDGYKCSRG